VAHGRRPQVARGVSVAYRRGVAALQPRFERGQTAVVEPPGTSLFERADDSAHAFQTCCLATVQPSVERRARRHDEAPIHVDAGARQPLGIGAPGYDRRSTQITTRQYARIVNPWVREIGLDAPAYGTHSLRRTRASSIYRRTNNLRAVQLLLAHTKLETTVRYLGIEVVDALELAEQTDV